MSLFLFIFAILSVVIIYHGRIGPKQLQQGRDCYENFTIWGEDAGPEHVFDHKSKMFFPKEYHKNAVGEPCTIPPY